MKLALNQCFETVIRPVALSSEVPIPTAAGEPASPAIPPASILGAEIEALKNDLAQARELAADFQRQLAEKTNECADLKRTAEAGQAEIGRLRSDISELRHERLQLANDVAGIAGIELRLKRTSEERDELRAQLEGLRARTTVGQRIEMASEGSVPFPEPEALGALSGNERVYAKRLLTQLAASVDELQTLVDPQREQKPRMEKSAKEGEIIAVSFVG